MRTDHNGGADAKHTVGQGSDGVKTTHIFLKHKTVLKVSFIEIAKAI